MSIGIKACLKIRFQDLSSVELKSMINKLLRDTLLNDIISKMNSTYQIYKLKIKVNIAIVLSNVQP